MPVTHKNRPVHEEIAEAATDLAAALEHFVACEAALDTAKRQADTAQDRLAIARLRLRELTDKLAPPTGPTLVVSDPVPAFGEVPRV